MLNIFQGRLDHCFSLTPTTIRHQLQMDEEAGYSITDEVTADQMTMKMLDAFHHVGCAFLKILFFVSTMKYIYILVQLLLHLFTLFSLDYFFFFWKTNTHSEFT